MNFHGRPHSVPEQSLQQPSAASWALVARGFDCLNHGLSVFDKDLRLVYFNRAFVELLDLPTDLICVGMHFEAMVRFNAERGEYGPGVADEQVAERVGIASRFEPRMFRRVRPNGKVLDIQGSPLEGGGFVTTYTDITGRTRAENRFNDALESMDEGFMLWSADDQLIACNRRAREMYPELQEVLVPGTGFEEILREAVGKGALLKPAGVDDEMWIADLIAEHRNPTRPFIRQTGSGRTLKIIENKTSEGGIVGILLDVTEQVTAEAALRDSEERFRDFAASASDWLWETGPDLRFTYLSDQFESITGVPAADVLGRTRADIGDAQRDDPRWVSHLDDLEARRPFRNFRYKVKAVAESPIYFQISGIPVYDGDGTFIGYRGTGSNVTAHVLAERESARSQRLLRDAIESIADGFALFGADDRLVLCNRSYKEALSVLDDVLVPGVLFETMFREVVARGHIWPPTADVDGWVEQRLEEHAAGCATRSFATSDGRWIEVREYPMRDGGRALVRSDITESRQIEVTLRKLSQAVEQSPAAVIVTDLTGSIEYVNPKFTEMTGYTADEATGANPRILQSGATDRAVYNAMWSTLIEGHVWRGEFRNRRKDGSSYWCGCAISAIKDTHGTITHYVGVQEDITRRKMAEDNLRRSEERYRSLVESSVFGIVIDQDGKPVFANQTYAQIFGYDRPEDILRLGNLDALYTASDRARIRQYRHNRAVGEMAPNNYAFQGVKRDGSLIWAETQVHKISWNGRPAIQSTVVDVTLRKLYEEQLHHQANFDQLTNLPNRTLALDRLHSAVVQSRRNSCKVGLLFIDIDHFKRINDTLGHAAGDRVLLQASVRIRECLREGDTVARLSGDEFTVIVPGVETPADVESVANKILAAFEHPFVLDEQEAFVGASIGISVGPDDSEDPETLLRNADAAMYAAKVKGRNTYCHFTRELNERAMERVRMEANLRRGLERDEFDLNFQPLVDVASGRIVGAEALLRWNNPELGVVSPDRFVPLAEDTGLIVPLGEWVLDSACRQVAEWHAEGLCALRLTVNVSARQFRGRTFVGAVARALDQHRIAPDSLELEITEGLLMDDLPESNDTLRDLDKCGVRLAVDDFGTGYSSLSYLKRFPFDTLKIDKSFIRDLATESEDIALVEAIIAMAGRLNLQVVAEGVESEEQLAFLRERGCQLAQGYLFSKPVRAEEFRSLLETSRGTIDIPN